MGEEKMKFIKCLGLLGLILSLFMPMKVKAASNQKEPKLEKTWDYQTKNFAFYIIRNAKGKNKNVEVAIRNRGTKVRIPETVMIQGEQYTVTTIIANAKEYNVYYSDEEKELKKDEKRYYSNTKTKEVIIPKTVTKVEAGAFNCFRKLKKITVVKGNKVFKSVKGALLSKNGKIFYAGPTVKGTYIIPSGVKTIDKRAFAYNKVQKVVLPKSCKMIDSRAFYRCTELKKINLNKVKSFGNHVFYKTKLKNVNKKGNII